MCTSLLFGQIGKKGRRKKKAHMDENDSMESVSDKCLIHQAQHGKPGQFVIENRWYC